MTTSIAFTAAELADRPWLKAYPAGVPADVNTSQYPSLVALMEEAFKKNAAKVAYSFMGKEVTFGETDSLSVAFGAYLQSLGLAKGERSGRRGWLRSYWVSPLWFLLTASDSQGWPCLWLLRFP